MLNVKSKMHNSNALSYTKNKLIYLKYNVILYNINIDLVYIYRGICKIRGRQA